MADDLTDTIQTNAAGPKRVRGDSGEMEQHPLSDQIVADRYLKSQTAARATGMGSACKNSCPQGLHDAK